eukprot:scaffold10255_cov22-Tisochrysis_lutea.AAC.3
MEPVIKKSSQCRSVPNTHLKRCVVRGGDQEVAAGVEGQVRYRRSVCMVVLQQLMLITSRSKGCCWGGTTDPEVAAGAEGRECDRRSVCMAVLQQLEGVASEN